MKLIKVELIGQEKGIPIYAVVDYITGTREIRYRGSKWMCLSFLTSMTSETQIALA